VKTCIIQDSSLNIVGSLTEQGGQVAAGGEIKKINSELWRNLSESANCKTEGNGTILVDVTE
jgi:phage baseplate assembly protein gpV